MPKGNSAITVFPNWPRQDARASTVIGNGSMRCSPSCAPPAPGGTGPRTLRPGARSIINFRLGKRTGLWEQIHPPRREHLRQVQGRKRHATAGIPERQSVQSTACSQELRLRRGHERQRPQTAGAGVAGPPSRPGRHAATTGQVLGPEKVAARQTPLGRRRLRRRRGIDWALKRWRCTVEIVKRAEAHTFRVLPRRWGSGHSAGGDGTAGSIGSMNAPPRRAEPSSMTKSVAQRNRAKGK